MDERIKNAIAAYKHYANLKSGEKIKEINNWALNESAIKYGMRKFDLKREILLYEIFKPLVTEHMDEINTSFENMILDAMLKHGDLGVKTVQQFIEEADKDMGLILNNTIVELAEKLKSFVDDN